jgi:RNA polymerase sigma-70 factor (ECF subfamily)
MARWTAAGERPLQAFAASQPVELMELARQAAAGDDAATRIFLRTVWPTVTRVITGVLGSGHPDLDDVVQQSLIGLLRALSLFRGECHPAGYASRIALHIALRARKRAGVDRLRARKLAELVPPTDALAPSASDQAASERRRQVLRDLLQDLPEEQAESLGLRIVLGWSLDEVALATGVPVNTVRSRVRLAKEALRKRIERDPDLVDALEVGR